ncbi:unnamed protein product [Cuscuta campestris]|uniref:Uncharacterized protein n=1 Tax=Cuscuta campestris TaxID=132261 RepID=A0A484LXL0_9ASTE|nr:unnamed protein product [Cuscuta campestris]VFQ89737.1 unnamed protein product [Cuscuta campestris]
MLSKTQTHWVVKTNKHMFWLLDDFGYIIEVSMLQELVNVRASTVFLDWTCQDNECYCTKSANVERG